MNLDELRKRIDCFLEWQREGNMCERSAASDAIHEIVRAKLPSAILYFREVAPEDTRKAAAAYLEVLKSRSFLIQPVVIGRIGAEKAREISLSRQPLYAEVYDLFFSSGVRSAEQRKVCDD